MPKVSVVIPVYKVEQYLEECLNSVLTQTLRDIEVIAVDDGSPDRCPQILDDYAARDSRITVIHKENGGLSSARNAAYPYIRGEYTLFVDSDDYVEPTLCEKTVAVADHERADMTLFLYRYTSSPKRRTPLEKFLAEHPFSEVGLKTLWWHVTAWSKLWRSQFLLDNQITFPEGLCFEDMEVHIRSLLQNPQTAVVPERLYWYRSSFGSITTDNDNERTFDIFPVVERIKNVLIDANHYRDEWKRNFLRWKLAYVYDRYLFVSERLKPQMLEKTKAVLGDDEREFLEHCPNIARGTRLFYRSLLGYPMADAKYWAYRYLSRTRAAIVKIFPILEAKLRRTG